MKDHFRHIYWFIVGLVAYGAFLTIFLIIHLPEKAAERVADTALIFWLSTAVAGGIGYLIGNSAKASNKGAGEPGSTTAEISATIHSEPKEEDK